MRASLDGLAAGVITLAIFVVYVATLAPTVLRSDSGEFHVVPWVLGVAHAPGYPLLTLLGRLAMLLPIGDPAYRVNLLDALAAAAAAGLVYLAVIELAASHLRPDARWAARAGGLAGALALGLGATYWQQSVVGGPRPLVFFFTALLLWLLFRWSNRRRTGDLVVLAGAAGLALTHHPNLLMLFPGLALYMLGRDPRLPLRFRQVGLGLLAFALPLVLYVYLPIRSAMNPPLGATNLADPRELALFVTAAHYQDAVLDNCGGSRLLQVQRYLVLLMLQFGPALPLLAALGAVATLVAAPFAGLTLLYAFASNATFGICSTLAMPDYVIPSYVVAATWLGLALAWPLGWLAARPRLRLAPAVLATGLALGLSVYRLVTGLPFQSMVGRAADAERAIAGMSQAHPNGLILSDWESITPLWYAQKVLGLSPGVKTAMVTAAPRSDQWLVAAEQGTDVRPVSLAQRVPALGEDYRLFPVSSLYDVAPKAIVEKGSVGLVHDKRALRLLGYHLDRSAAKPGDLVHLTLYQRESRDKNELDYLPVLRLAGDPPVEFAFSGDQHYPVPTWRNDEVVGEVYEFGVPAWMSPGDLELQLAYRVNGRDELVGLEGGEPWTTIGWLRVLPPTRPVLGQPPATIANFSDQFVLRSGRASAGGAAADLAGDLAGLRLRPGTTLEVDVTWSALHWMDESYTLFVHLLDGDRRLVAQQDALPLGGIYHTYKWVPGQAIADRYRLPLPPDLPPGEYYLEIGAYHALTNQRLAVLGPYGGSDSTAFVTGPLRAE